MKLFNKGMVLLASIGAMSFIACSGGATKSGSTLYVVAYDGGYGIDYLKAIGQAFEKETGIHVEAKADSTVFDTLENQLKKNPDYDIYMSHGINWRSYAQSGYLESLDDLYETNVPVGSGSKKFVDRMVSGAAEISKAVGADKTTQHYYKVCFTQGAGGFVYNIDMFTKNGWLVPTTYDELMNLCQQIVDAKVPLASGRGTVAPIAWSGAERAYYWDYVMNEWWAELAGIEKINTIKKYLGPDGSYEKGYEMFNPETYYKEFVEAYGKWYDLIALHSNYSLSGSKGNSLLRTQSAFINGEAAMIPYAQWAKFELEKANGGKALSFNIAMMKTPKISSTSQEVNYNVGFDDSMIIPSKISDESKGYAKQFIQFMARPESCRTFVEKTKGAFLAFDYKDVELGTLANDTYISSVYNKITQGTNFNTASANPIAYNNGPNIIQPWIDNTYYYTSAMDEPNKYTPEIVGGKVYNTAKSGWPTWLRNAGL